MNRNSLILLILGIVALFTIMVNYNMFQDSHKDEEMMRALFNNNEALQKALTEQRLEITKLKTQIPREDPKAEIDRLKESNKREIEKLTAEYEHKLQQLRQVAAATSGSERESLLLTELQTEKEEVQKLRKEVETLLLGKGVVREKEKRLKEKLKEYTQLHNDITSGKLPPRFIQCVLINGWGNVIQEAVSCFLIALVSRRAVVFNASPLEGYMPFKKFLGADKLPFDGYNLRRFQFSDELVIPRFNWTCLNYREDYKDVEYITIHLTYDYFATNAIINPYHSAELEPLLPRNYFQVIFEYLFKLDSELQAIVDDFKSKNFGKYTVGIQIRNPSKTTAGKVDHKGFPVPPIDLYAEVAEQLSRFQEVTDYNDAVWFMATQNLKLIEYMQSAYGKKRVVWYNSTMTTTFESNFDGQRTSLVTWWLLGECNEVITTEASSYGTTAAARSGITPIVCNHHKYCMRRLTPTPCQDTYWLAEQPQDCLMKLRQYPHQFMTSPEASCGFYKLFIYQSKEYQDAQRAADHEVQL